MPRFWLVLVVFFGFGVSAFAADSQSPGDLVSVEERINGPRAYLGIGADNLAPNRRDETSIYGQIEAASGVLHDPSGFRFRIGADFSGVGVWVGGGMSLEWVGSDAPFYLELNSMVGLYEEFDDLDLSHPIQFRTQLAVGYHLDNGYDVAIGVAHKSNANIGSRNPGSETVFIRFGKDF